MQKPLCVLFVSLGLLFSSHYALGTLAKTMARTRRHGTTAGETRRTEARAETAPQSTEATTMEKGRERKSAQRMRI